MRKLPIDVHIAPNCPFSSDFTHKRNNCLNLQVLRILIGYKEALQYSRKSVILNEVNE